MKTLDTQVAPYHILMVLAGRLLSENGNKPISPITLQNEALKSPEVEYRLPLEVCQESLMLLYAGNFLVLSGEELIAGTRYPLYNKKVS